MLSSCVRLSPDRWLSPSPTLIWKAKKTDQTTRHTHTHTVLCPFVAAQHFLTIDFQKQFILLPLSFSLSFSPLCESGASHSIKSQLLPSQTLLPLLGFPLFVFFGASLSHKPTHVCLLMDLRLQYTLSYICRRAEYCVRVSYIPTT